MRDFSTVEQLTGLGCTCSTGKAIPVLWSPLSISCSRVRDTARKREAAIGVQEKKSLHESYLIIQSKQDKAARQRRRSKGPTGLFLSPGMPVPPKTLRHSVKLALCCFPLLSTRPLAAVCVFGFHLESGQFLMFF